MKIYEKIQSRYTEYQQKKPIIPGATEGSDFIDSLKACVIYVVLRINRNWTLLNNYLNTLGYFISLKHYHYSIKVSYAINLTSTFVYLFFFAFKKKIKVIITIKQYR